MKISVCTPTIRPDGLKIVQECLSKQTFPSGKIEWLVEVGYGKHDLNASYNRMIRRAKGDVFVSVQDYTNIPPDFLEKISKKYEESDKRTFYTIPLGKTLDWEKVEWDWRKYAEKCIWNGWEIDAGFCPMDALWEIGGFDEKLDEKWSFDNVSVGYRAQAFGYNFGVFSGTEAVAFDHDKKENHPFRKDFSPEHWKLVLDSYRFEPKLRYLTKD